MKTLIAVALMLISSLSFAQLARYQVMEGKLHSGGTLGIEVLNVPHTYRLNVHYNILKRPMVPIPVDLKGVLTVNLPEMMKDERGYLEVEQKKSIMFPGLGLLKFVRRINLGTYRNAYVVDFTMSNNKAKFRIVYHPTCPGAGWIKGTLTLLDVTPILNGYEVVAIYSGYN